MTQPPGTPRPAAGKGPQGLGRISQSQKAAEPDRICGLTAVSALFACRPDAVLRLFYVPQRRREAGPFCALMARARRPYREVPAEELARVAGTEHHGGLVAVAIGREITLLVPGAEAPELFAAPVLPVLDGVGNPHNLGAVARSAAFFGCSALVLSGDPRQAGLSDAAWRIAEGGLEHLALFRAPDLPSVLRSLAPRLASVAAVPRGGVAPEAIPRDRPIALLMGNEEVGLSAPMIDACAHRVTLPGSGLVESLNVSAASAVLIHALSQGRGIPGGGASAHVGSGRTGPR